METNLDELDLAVSSYTQAVHVLNAAITKYEDGLLALQNLPVVESMQLELNSAKEHLFEGLKLLNVVYQYLKVPKIVEECVKVEIPEEIDHKLMINNTKDVKNYNCDICNKTFKTERFFQRHKFRVHGENLEKEETKYFDYKDWHENGQIGDNIESENLGFLGIECFGSVNEIFIDKENLTTKENTNSNNKISVITIHKNNMGLSKNVLSEPKIVTQFPCSKSDSVFDKPSLLNKHFDTKHSHSKNLICPVCDEASKSWVLLKAHILKHFITNPYACDFCSETFSLKNQLIIHTKAVHSNPEESKLYTNHLFSCNICKKDNSCITEFKKHINKCAVTNFSIKLDEVFKISDEENGKCICYRCGKEFLTKAILAQHALIHGDYNFTCKQCNKKFKLKRSYTRHLRVHKGERPYKCDQCPREYFDMASLKDHQVTHGTEKFFKCEVCEKEFFYAQSYKYHMRTHNGEKPYSCETCGKSFTQNSNLKDHMKIHTGLKPFKCEMCGKDFARKTDLGHHHKTHTGERPHKCDRCGMTFSRSGRLNAHMRLHTGERPYKCDICSKAFREKSGLNRHSMIHSGQRPHKCDICGQGFIQSGALNSHKKSQHIKETVVTVTA